MLGFVVCNHIVLSDFQPFVRSLNSRMCLWYFRAPFISAHIVRLHHWSGMTVVKTQGTLWCDILFSLWHTWAWVCVCYWNVLCYISRECRACLFLMCGWNRVGMPTSCRWIKGALKEERKRRDLAHLWSSPRCLRHELTGLYRHLLPRCQHRATLYSTDRNLHPGTTYSHASLHCSKFRKCLKWQTMTVSRDARCSWTIWPCTSLSVKYFGVTSHPSIHRTHPLPWSLWNIPPYVWQGRAVFHWLVLPCAADGPPLPSQGGMTAAWLSSWTTVSQQWGRFG